MFVAKTQAVDKEATIADEALKQTRQGNEHWQYGFDPKEKQRDPQNAYRDRDQRAAAPPNWALTHSAVW